MPIRSFASRRVERFFVEGRTPRAGWRNRLEALKGNLAGLHSIRINDQWRIVFRWTPSGPTEVDIRDYH